MASTFRNLPKVKGRRLFEILNTLPDYGIGRVFTRTSWLSKFPDEPSYIRITSVTVDTEKPNLNGGEVWANRTWRGYRKDGLEVKITAWHKSEWKLIRKSEEADFCAYTPKKEDFHVVPNSIPLPPLLDAMMRQKMEREGDVSEEKLKLKLIINQTYVNRAYQLPES
ncbi:28S ribosomal protein S34, mitochondrial-like [Anneissia japonica]|uniref:28S ribosomal protein S34, mitochondrial-like n=1 Tax=Anneissia japonica TaxID=1529436 RepID=UPI0014258C67|nr:28S ribosomal protein S34, mitochondrial-like [Anneissia japonica]